MKNRFDLSAPIPCLIVGDAADLPTGLGRIGHDLAWLLSSMPQFQVGYLGRQSFGRAKYPWANYSFHPSEQWGETRIREAWQDLAQGRRGVIFTIWDASRLLWFADGRGTGLEEWLGSREFERWGYFMVDGAGVRRSALPLEQAHVMSCYDRVITASKWGWELARESVEHRDLDWLPHPINRKTFYPMERWMGRSGWGVDERTPVIGCVMANQARKHWPTVMEMLALLPGYRLWIHTDTLLNDWNITALATEYGVQERVIHEPVRLSDRELAMRYSACNATVVVSGGEGFCYPVAESLSCGTPAVTGGYGAQAELTPWRVTPSWYRVDTSHNVLRAEYDARGFAELVGRVVEENREGQKREECVGLVEHLEMSKLGVQWRRWFERGLQT